MLIHSNVITFKITFSRDGSRPNSDGNKCDLLWTRRLIQKDCWQGPIPQVQAKDGHRLLSFMMNLQIAMPSSSQGFKSSSWSPVSRPKTTKVIFREMHKGGTRHHIQMYTKHMVNAVAKSKKFISLPIRVQGFVSATCTSPLKRGDFHAQHQLQSLMKTKG